MLTTPSYATDRYVHCHACDKAQPSREALLQHIRQRHLDVAPFNCDQCGVAYQSKKRWDQHVYLHHNGDADAR